MNPYPPGYSAVPPPAWGAPPNYPGVQQFSRPGPARNRSAADIVAGVGLMVAAIVSAAHSIWGMFGRGGGYSVFEYGMGVVLIPFWVVCLVALVGGIGLSVAGSGSMRLRTVASLGAGPLLLTVAQHVVALFFDSYLRWSDNGNWLVIPTAVAVLAAVGGLVAGRPGTSAGPAYPPLPAGFAPYPGMSGHPGAPAAPPGYPVHPGPAAPQSSTPQSWPQHPGLAAPDASPLSGPSGTQRPEPSTPQH
ncbi:hypothetical protein [Nocardia veterana]|uniref:Uncharacterized protein n=1 Tax=Nocardia veterana TaxID=132249 RepID=A0A7X6LZJ6_9NOCA|nr:hypothetical protein [Nocardia veterana]NKY87452.1 hypothetical protein [Nocardia veterana]